MGKDADAIEAAKVLGKLVAKQGMTLVYGGAKVGLMGTIADAALQAGGKVIGVIPFFLAGREIAHEGLTELIRVQSMHERKTKMAELSDGFIAMPGGFGTLEELFEIVTWAQLDLHSNPIGVLNVNGYYDLLFKQLKVMVDQELLRQANYDLLLNDHDPESLLNSMLKKHQVEGGPMLSTEDT